MLIRFVAKNIFSFNEETEFNLFPNKTQRLPHHKIHFNGVDFLRLSAIYGANGSGKSNLIRAISTFEMMVEKGNLPFDVSESKFRLNSDNQNIPISFGIEFLAENKIYYYTLTYNEGEILQEYLVESKKDNDDELIFIREIVNGKQKIEFYKEYSSDKKNQLFVEVLAEKLLQKDELLLSFLNSKYPNEFLDIKNVYNWFDKSLVIIRPHNQPSGIAHILDLDKNLIDFANLLMTNTNTGISKIEIEKRKLDDILDNSEQNQFNSIVNNIKNKPNAMSVIKNPITGEEATIVNENNEVVLKRIVTRHLNNLNENVEFSIGMESDGTQRLIDYIPALNDIINRSRVYLIDEIERSIHPNTIKEIISKISLDESAKGQLIFTTHESCLLDQDILRPDEIWFSQKDIDGSTRLYSLSDFNIHNTANIENGYLNGRYGGIPFLSNLHDLNWHRHAVSE
ncbi:ATP-binding protein [Aquirufa nivalisilvae]|uniref:AAA family ATPase n=1 Tax=Aquirufa nivalisilvae TaxID=2516557 RepID=UPI0022A91FCA|nr:ATP-binding protein [Aquirufa nivalisilvae]MCZ2481440.1 ATP-binding protein [Aquirufa nivalisilvae]